MYKIKEKCYNPLRKEDANMVDINKMTKNTKLEVAIEVISAKIANLSKEGYSVNDDQMKKLLEERTKMYSGDEETIDKIIREYGPEIKQKYDNV